MAKTGKTTKKSERKEKRQEQEQEDDTQEDRGTLIKAASVGLKKAKTADDVREVWKASYLTIGHRILGRLLLGQDVKSATRTRQKE